MKTLIKKAVILDRSSVHYKECKDILIEDGIIKSIGDQLNIDDETTTIESKQLHISQSWVDLKADFCDPGNELDEDIPSGLDAAQAGGFGHVFVVPTTTPVVDSKGQVKYMKSQSWNHVTTLHPMGTISKNNEGKSLAEMYDMYKSGVRFFTDNSQLLSADILLRAVMYAQNFEGKIISFPQNLSLTYHGQINEGEASLKTGMKSMPAIGEKIQVERDLSILEYTGGSLHFSGISSADSLTLIKEAKDKGMKVTCDVFANHLLFNETSTLHFDTNFKVFPPYRREHDRQALVQGVKNGTIDCIVSNHQPKISDKKDVEFDNAAFGNTVLQTLYSSLNKAFHEEIEYFIDAISINPRKIISFDASSSIAEGNKIDCTLFDPSLKWKFDATTNRSKSKNSPFYGQEMQGKVIGILKGEQVFINH